MRTGKKILIISPIPSHPQNKGNRASLFSLSAALRQLGHDIHFLFLKRPMPEPGDEAAMRRFWGNGFHLGRLIYPRKSFTRRMLQKIRYVSNRNFYFLDSWFYTIDDWYHPSIDDQVKKLAGEIDFEVVIADYVFFSRALPLFDKHVLKVINTHDVFTDRHRQYDASKDKMGHYSWFTTTRREEAKGLSRADLILAKQDDERIALQSMTDKEVVTVGHLFDTHPPAPRASLNHEILFVASSAIDNRIGANFFMEQVFSRVRSKYKDSKFLLAGGICEYVEDYPHCVKLGVVDELTSVYTRADLVVNPVLTGTGLPLKSVEAMSYSKPLVTTPSGARGLKNGGAQSFLVGATAEELAAHIVRVFEERELRESLSHNAYQFANAHNKTNLENLASAIN